MQQDLLRWADVVVLLLAGGQPAGPGLPVSVSPPGAHHRVGTPILLLLMVPMPAGMGGSCCLCLVLSLFWESCLHPAPLHTQGTSLPGVVQAQGGPCSQMLMVVNMGRGDSRSRGQAAGASFVAKIEHAPPPQPKFLWLTCCPPSTDSVLQHLV